MNAGRINMGASADDPSMAAFRAQRDSAVGQLGQPDWTKPEVAWPLEVTDPHDGKTYKGTFRSRAPRLGEQDEINMLAARLAGGAPWDSLPTQTRARLVMFASFTVLLTDRPDWFANPADFYTETVPAAVYGKLREHLTGFFRRDDGRSTSPKTDVRPVPARTETADTNGPGEDDPRDQHESRRAPRNR